MDEAVELSRGGVAARLPELRGNVRSVIVWEIFFGLESSDILYLRLTLCSSLRVIYSIKRAPRVLGTRDEAYMHNKENWPSYASFMST